MYTHTSKFEAWNQYWDGGLKVLKLKSCVLGLVLFVYHRLPSGLKNYIAKKLDDQKRVLNVCINAINLVYVIDIYKK